MYVDPTGFMKSYAEWRAENPDDGPVWSVIHYFMYVLGETAEGIKTWGETHWAQMQMAFGSAQAYAAASTTPDVPLPQGTKAGQGKDWDPYSKRKDASRKKYPYPENPTDVWDYYPGEDWVEDADLFKNEITSSLSSDLSKKESLYDFFRNVVGPGLVVVGLFKKNPVLKVLGVTVGLGFMSMPSMEEHYNRNQHNIWFPDVYDDKYFYGWDDNVDASCHQFSSPNKSHKKYVSPDGRYEVIYDANDIRVDDPRDVGTYNFANPNTDMMGHFFKDVLPWIIWGNSPDDLTVWEERLEVFLTAIPNGTLRKVGVEI